MARIRTIKPEFWTSEQVVECSPMARLLFIGIWNFCDDGGVHPASIKRLKMEVFPGDAIESSDIESMVYELIDRGLLVSYEVAGQGFWCVTGWHHQRVDKPNLKYPKPPIEQEFVEYSENDSGAVDEHSPPESSLRESRGRESKKSTGGSRISVSPNGRHDALTRKLTTAIACPNEADVLAMVAGLVTEGYLPEAHVAGALDDLGSRSVDKPLAYFWTCLKTRAEPLDVNALMRRVRLPKQTRKPSQVKALLESFANEFALTEEP